MSDREGEAARYLEIGLAFWQAKALMTAVELGVFSELGKGDRTAAQLTTALGLNGRGARDLFDCLVALGVLDREGEHYRNTPGAADFLVANSDSYVGGALDLANLRLYPVWGRLTEALRSGLPQNEAAQEKDYYGDLTRHPERLRVFLRAMSGLSLASSRAIARKFPWREFRSFVDVGGAQGELAVQLVKQHPHLSGVTFDLSPVRPFFEEHVTAHGLADRLEYVTGDFFTDSLPAADVIVMGHVLHNWDLERKRLLIRKAYDALPRRGALVVYEAIIDDERRANSFGLLMSLNMLLVTSGGFVFTGAECRRWMADAGFDQTELVPLQGPDSMVIGHKW